MFHHLIKLHLQEVLGVDLLKPVSNEAIKHLTTDMSEVNDEPSVES